MIYSPNLKNMLILIQENRNQFDTATCVKLALDDVKGVIASMDPRLWAASVPLAQMSVLLLQFNVFMNVGAFI